MIIKVDQGKQISVLDITEEFEKIWTECLEAIYHEDRIIHHVQIDGHYYYSDYENYIKNNMGLTKEVHVISSSRQESISETETALSEYLTRYIPVMNNIANKLYGDVSPETWEEFAAGLKGLQWIMSSFEFLRFLYETGSEEKKLIQDGCSQLSQIVKELDNEMQSDHLVGVADLLQYELLPFLNSFLTDER
ncbi:hypothetical protein [Gorillibacterium massiliense]|uniref:hypothetical protein n=1 Tax=Gorillibacterium massiliense TaxID=1280390 RepID=UPI0005933789|nr:hypothetical protein [Gorillibacterium massiliense]